MFNNHYSLRVQPYYTISKIYTVALLYKCLISSFLGVEITLYIYLVYTLTVFSVDQYFSILRLIAHTIHAVWYSALM